MYNQIPENLNDKCHAIIHTAAAASAGVAISPIPGSDTPALIAIQVTMIVALGNVFDVTLDESYATSLAKTAVASQLGKYLAGQALKFIPFLGSGSSAIIAAGITEELGWETARSFYEKSQLDQCA